MITPAIPIAREPPGIAHATAPTSLHRGHAYALPDESWTYVFFTESANSQASAREFLQRFRLRTLDRDTEVKATVAPAQLEALGKWGAPRDNPFDYLHAINPTLVINGDQDVIIDTSNSLILQRHIPKARLILHPDANHGAQYQYPQEFTDHITMFLNA